MIKRVLRSVLNWALRPDPIQVKLDWVNGNSPRIPSRKYRGDAGFDLYLSTDICIPPEGFVDVPTGVYLCMPEGVWGRITNRSSTFRAHGVNVLEGIIDNGYSGELFIGVINRSEHPVRLDKGARIAQIIFHQLVCPQWIQVDTLPENPYERGTGGFGSTGV